MKIITKVRKHLSIVFFGRNYYACQGIIALLNGTGIDTTLQIADSAENHQQLENILMATNVDVLFMTGEGGGTSRFDSLTYIKSHVPGIMICMYSTQSNSKMWLQGDVDIHISLQAPVHYWRTCLIKMANKYHAPPQKKEKLTLTSGEWRVLKALQNGQDMRYIAEKENISYRRVSALKNSAIRKLGLRNKTELLVFLTN